MNDLIPSIAGGTVALVAGGAALFLARKTPALHARAGAVFFAAMLVLAGTGALIAAMKPERGTAVIGVLACCWSSRPGRRFGAATARRVGFEL